MVAYTGSSFCDYFMKRRQFVLQLARWVGVALVVCILAGVHTETVVPRSFGAANFQKVTRSWVVGESQPTQRRAITNSQQQSGVYDKKQKIAPPSSNVSELKVSSIAFYKRVDRYHPAPNWFLLTNRNGKIHSQQYA